MKPVIVALIVGLGAGFGVGYWVAPGGREGEIATGEQVGSREEIQVAAISSGPEEAGRPVKVIRRIRVPAKQEFADVAACKQEVERLTATVEELARENTEHQQLMEHQTGKTIPFPEKLDPKYLEPALMKNLNKAFEEVGLDGDVSFVDCDEFPCIVCAGLGAGQGQEADMNATMDKLRKLNESEAMSDYKDAQRLNTVIARREENDGGTSHTLNNCQAIYPELEDARLREELQKRLSWRLNQLSESM
jgi:hypothetical protein